MNPRYPKYLSDDKLQKLSTQRLVKVLDSARASHSYVKTYFGHRCCEICHEYVGDDYEKDVEQYARPLEEYMNKIKSILSEPRHKN